MRCYFFHAASLASAVLAALAIAACSGDDGHRNCDGAACGEVDAGADVARPDRDAGPDVVTCAPGVDRACVSDTEYAVCNAEGDGFGEPVACGQFQSCEDGVCKNPTGCDPGPLRCIDTQSMEVCLQNGFQREVVACDPGEECLGNGCVNPACSDNVKSYTGCEFWATDLYNEPAASVRPAVISVSNVNDHPVTVNLVNMETTAFFEETLEAGAIGTFTLNGIQLEGTSLSRKTFMVESSAPVMVHQFNPRNNSLEVYSNDASLLLPSGALGSDYLVMAWPARDFEGSGVLTSIVTIVATQNGTSVTITANEPVRAGGDIAAIGAGEQRTIVLNRGQVLSLESPLADAADLTGMRIDASKPIAVFAGNQCAQVPLGTAYCDHLEQQLMPINTWGTTYVGPKYSPRGNEPDVWRVLAATDGTTLTTTPAIAGVDGETLDAGEHLDFLYEGDFLLEASAPVSVGQFMVGSQYGCDEAGNGCAMPERPACGSLRIGDPAFTLTVPHNQFRDDYLVLVPEDYVENYVSVVFETGTGVAMNGEPLDTSAASDLQDTGWSVLRLLMDEGQHLFTGDEPFGLYVYGYDCDVSYAYPGGLDLRTDVP